MARVAIYTRVSTDDQKTANQLTVLQDWAAKAGHEIVATFEDAGISGTKGKDKRPGFKALLKACVQRKVEMIAVWSTDRLGRSMPHLIEVLQTIRDTGVGLYIHTQGVDTNTPAGRMLFQMLGVMAEFERELLVSRTIAGLDHARAHGTRSGKAIGRPRRASYDLDSVRDGLSRGLSVRAVMRETGASLGQVAAVRKQLVAEDALPAAA